MMLVVDIALGIMLALLVLSLLSSIHGAVMHRAVRQPESPYCQWCSSTKDVVYHECGSCREQIKRRKFQS